MTSTSVDSRGEWLALLKISKMLGAQSSGLDAVQQSVLHSDKSIPSTLDDRARSIGLKVQSMQLVWRDLLRLYKSVPLVIKLKGGGVMILVRVERRDRLRQVVLIDPTVEEASELIFSQHQFMRIWSGEAIRVWRHFQITEEAQPFGYGLVGALIFRERRILRDIALSAIVLSLLALAPTIFFQLLFNKVLRYSSANTLVIASFIMMIVVVVETVYGFLRRMLIIEVTSRIDVYLTSVIFSRVLGLPVDYFERNPAGLTTYKMMQIGRVRNFLTGQLFGTFLDAGILLFFIPVMVAFSPALTSVVVIFGALILFWIGAMLPILRARSGALEAAEAARGSFLSQNIYGIRTIKSLALEAKRRREWDSLSENVSKHRYKQSNISNLVQTIVLPLERLMVGGSYGLGVYFAITTRDPVLVGSLFAFLMLSQRVAGPLMQMAQLVQQFDDARTAVDVIGSLVNLEPEESGHGINKPLEGHVEFAEVRFQYKGAMRPALKDVSFKIRRGSTLGVMGRSGSGKTTITRLIQRLHSNYFGLIKIDGIDIRTYDLMHLRSSLGVVLQENFLFSGTIRENITCPKVDASYEDMVHAARLAGAEEFIDKMPQGYETYIYEGSPNLSGGQRQRLAIARALITDPKILILDEATSALDAESEAIVNANIDHIAVGRTVITISHRLSALVKADAIMVMEQGQVNDIGKHEELLERNDIYAGLWYTQNQHTGAPARSSPPRLAPPPRN